MRRREFIAGISGAAAWPVAARSASVLILDALANPAVRRRLTDLGFDIASREQQTPEALATLQKAEIEKWWPIIKAAN